MSDKQQGTAASMREKMLSRYGNEVHHKHDKNHISYRKHFKSHPVQPTNGLDESDGKNLSTGAIREYNLRKMRKRLDKGRFH